MAANFSTLKEFQADIKKRYPLGVPWITPYEAFCQHYYNFAVIAEDYGLVDKSLVNHRPIRVAPRVLPDRPPMQPIRPREVVKGVQL
jgi:hypothetical protein